MRDNADFWGLIGVTTLYLLFVASIIYAIFECTIEKVAR
jgi:hypothetical protein